MTDFAPRDRFNTEQAIREFARVSSQTAGGCNGGLRSSASKPPEAAVYAHDKSRSEQ